MDVFYICHNRCKYHLQAHIVLVTKYRKKLLVGELAAYAKQQIANITNSKGHDIEAMEVDKDHLHILLSYRPTDCLSDIVKTLKQQSTYYLWQKYPTYLSKHYWKKHIFWSDGYFVCSVGAASADTIQRYIENQG